MRYFAILVHLHFHNPTMVTIPEQNWLADLRAIENIGCRK